MDCECSACTAFRPTASAPGNSGCHSGCQAAALQLQHLKRRALLQGFKGAAYGTAVALDTKMTSESNSVTCIRDQKCLPLGGYSVWAAMPPFPLNSALTTQPRQQIVVMSHWDSRSLFRYMATVCMYVCMIT